MNLRQVVDTVLNSQTRRSLVECQIPTIYQLGVGRCEMAGLILTKMFVLIVALCMMIGGEDENHERD